MPRKESRGIRGMTKNELQAFAATCARVARSRRTNRLLRDEAAYKELEATIELDRRERAREARARAVGGDSL